MKKVLLVFTFLVMFFLSGAYATPCDTCKLCDSVVITNQNVSNKFLKKFYIHNQLDQYLNNYQENVIYQIETTGDFSQIDPYVFSFAGNSFQWNKYYYNSFRINDCFFPGTALHKPLLDNISLEIDHLNSSLLFSTDSIIDEYVSLQYNHGGLGGPSMYSEDLIHLFHRTAREALYKPVPDQRRIVDAINFVSQTNINFKNKNLPQQFSFNHGKRILPNIQFDGIRDFYTENYSQFQAGGELPVLFNLFDKTQYLFSVLDRSHFLSERYYNKDETAGLNNVNFSYGGSKTQTNVFLSSGLNVSYKNIKHNDINFYRNIVDQDGESFEPWYTDANVIELSHAFEYKRKLFSKTFFTVNAFNAAIVNSPISKDFFNPVYYESFNRDFTPLYIYKWNAKKFSAGLLENTAGFNTSKTFGKGILILKASADITFDGVLLSDKSLLRPGWQASGSIIFKPFKFVELSVLTGRNRIAFNYDLVRFLSNDYLNGSMFYWNDLNNDRLYSANETGKLLSTTGGLYHATDSHLKQPAYYFLEIPLQLNVSKTQTITFTSYYKKYLNSWYVDYTLPENQNSFSINDDNQSAWYFMLPQQRYYSVVQSNTSHMDLADKNEVVTNSPFSQGYTFKYQKLGEKLFFSASWTAFMVHGFGALGNGVYTNNIGVLSESQANKNTKYLNTGRLDSDRGYIARLLLSYKISKKITTAFQFLYKDGQPMAFFNSELYVDANGTQVALRNDQPKGGNRYTEAGGPRKDGFFNTELRFEYKATIKKHVLKTNITFYNIYDFGTELAEYAFFPSLTKRYSLELNIPRGVMLALQYSL